MGKLYLAIKGSLAGELKKLPFAGSKVSNSERLWCVYEIKKDAEFTIVIDRLTYKQARQYILDAERPKQPPLPKSLRQPDPVINERDALILKQITQGVSIKKVAEEQGLSRQRVAKIWQKHNPEISLRELHRSKSL